MDINPTAPCICCYTTCGTIMSAKQATDDKRCTFNYKLTVEFSSKKFKSIQVWQNYGHESVVPLFWPALYFFLCPIQTTEADDDATRPSCRVGVNWTWDCMRLLGMFTTPGVGSNGKSNCWWLRLAFQPLRSRILSWLSSDRTIPRHDFSPTYTLCSIKKETVIILIVVSLSRNGPVGEASSNQPIN